MIYRALIITNFLEQPLFSDPDAILCFSKEFLQSHFICKGFDVEKYVSKSPCLYGKDLILLINEIVPAFLDFHKQALMGNHERKTIAGSLGYGTTISLRDDETPEPLKESLALLHNLECSGSTIAVIEPEEKYWVAFRDEPIE